MYNRSCIFTETTNKEMQHPVKTKVSNVNEKKSCKDSSNYQSYLFGPHPKKKYNEKGSQCSSHDDYIWLFLLLHLKLKFTFFDQLHKHRVVTTHCEPKAIFIFLDDYASLDQTCKWDKQDRDKIQYDHKGQEPTKKVY